jgi:hypothetical protein
MDMQTSGPIDAAISADEPYLRRAQALVAARAELFAAGAGVVRFAGVAGSPQDRAGPLAPPTRQLTLPLPRERVRRRARMVR